VVFHSTIIFLGLDFFLIITLSIITSSFLSSDSSSFPISSSNSSLRCLVASKNSFSICFFTFQSLFAHTKFSINTNNKKNQYIAASIHITLHGADHSG